MNESRAGFVGSAFLLSGGNAMASKRYDAIDLCKLFCALLVAMIHANATGDTFSYFFVGAFSQQAVPFFFIVSGFFFSNKLIACKNDTEAKSITLTYIKKNFLLYMAWQLVWAWYTLKDYLTIYSGDRPIKIVLILLRRLFFAGNGVYWYVLVCAEAAVIIYILHKFKFKKLMYALVFLGISLSIIYNCFGDTEFIAFQLIHKAFYFVFSWSNNVIMMGFPYMAIGYAFASGDFHIKRKTSAVLLVLSNVLNPLLYIVLVHYHVVDAGSYCLLYILQAVSLFALAFNSTVSVKNSVVFRELSNSIYFLHTTFIYWLMDPFMKFMPNPFLRAGLSVILSLVVYFIVKKLKIKPIKYLLSVS